MTCGYTRASQPFEHPVERRLEFVDSLTCSAMCVLFRKLMRQAPHSGFREFSGSVTKIFLSRSSSSVHSVAVNPKKLRMERRKNNFIHLAK